ncbi:MAG TPA: hypothetical protein V6C81_15240 [Planktothrix sp.]
MIKFNQQYLPIFACLLISSGPSFADAPSSDSAIDAQKTSTNAEIAFDDEAEQKFLSGLRKQVAGDIKGAIEEYKQGPNDAASHWYLAKAYEEIGDKKSADDEFEKERQLKLNPSSKTTEAFTLNEIFVPYSPCPFPARTYFQSPSPARTLLQPNSLMPAELE